MTATLKPLGLLLVPALFGAACISFDDARSEFCQNVDTPRQQALCAVDPDDKVAPSVVSVTPSEPEADASTSITVTFSEPMSQGSLSSSTFSVRRGAAPVAGSVRVEGATATFIPSGGLALLGEYSVVVAAEVRDLAGNALGEARRWTFRTRDGAWGPASAFEEVASGLGPQPRVAVSASGQALAVWTRVSEGRDDLWASLYTPARGWSAPQLVEFNDFGTVSDPQVAMDAAGNAHVLWVQRDASVSSIWATRYVAGSGWTTPLLLEDINVADALSPRLGVNASGAAAAVWQQGDGTRVNVWSNRFVPGVGWGTAERVESLDTGDATEPQVALGDDGTTVAIWTQSTGERLDISASTRPAQGSWSAPESINNEDLGSASSPVLALDAAGNAVAAWLHSDGTAVRVWGNRYVPGTGWGSSARLDSQVGSSTRPALSVHAGGEALAVWSQEEAGTSRIWANRYEPGKGWGEASRVSASDGGYTPQPVVAFDALGNALAVWVQQRREGGQGLACARYLPGGAWGTPMLIETPSTGSPGPPSLGMDARGGATVVWMQTEGAGVARLWTMRRE